MRSVLRSYEPVFGGIVAILSAAFLCFVLLAPSPFVLDGPTVQILAWCGAGISWGLLQVVEYRSAKRENAALAEPAVGTAVGCVLLGLILALMTVLIYEFAQNTWYVIATGFVTALLLCTGAVVGIRQGTWK